MLGPLFIAPHLLKEHQGGKSIKRKLSPKGGDPPQKFGKESTKESNYIVRSVCDVPWSPTCETVKRETVVLTLLPSSMAIFNSGRRTLGDVRPLDAEPGIEPRLGPF